MFWLDLAALAFGWACLAPGLRPVAAQASQPSLPVCPPAPGLAYLYPSPFFEDDQTLFWTYYDIRSAGVQRSSDNGRTWLEVLSFAQLIGSPLVTQFEIAPVRQGSGLTTYAFIWETTWEPDTFLFFRSQNGGDAWSEGSPPCTARDCTSNSLRAANRSGVLFQPRKWINYGPGLPEGVARSGDGGATWQQVWSETPAEAVAISPNFDQDETVFVPLALSSTTLNTNFIISHDAGDSWSAGGQGLCPYLWRPRLVVSPNIANDHTLLLSLYQSSLFMSQDSGLTWRPIFPPGGTYCGENTDFNYIYPQFSPDYGDDKTIYAATPLGLYASYDAGESWVVLAPGAGPYGLHVRRAPGAPPSTPPKLSDDAPQLTDDANWVFLPLVAVQGSGPPYRPHTLFMRASPAGGSSSVYRSDDGGRTWQCMNIPSVRTRAYLPLLRIRS
jgi:photosystem II stability/assembly factor-like uncharacterized protein